MKGWLAAARKRNSEELERSVNECKLNSEDVASNSNDELIALARENMNVFPYHTVSKCWFHLYIDGNIKKALGIMSGLIQTPHLKRQTDQETETQLRLAVECLDMALILAGGQDRNELVELIFGGIRELACTLGNSNFRSQDEAEGRQAKKPRLDEEVERQSTLPSKLSFVPKIEWPIERLERPSLNTFERYMRESKKPVILSKTLEHWPALTKWQTTDFWLNVTLGGRRLVPIEVGQSYNDEGWSQEIMPLKQFLDKFIMNGDESSDVGYLAQHDLMSQIPALRNDVPIPDYCYCEPLGKEKSSTKHSPTSSTVDLEAETPEMSKDVRRPGSDGVQDAPVVDDDSSDIASEIHQNIWFGGRTVSPLHHDPYHNILCQVHGTKYIRLYAPHQTHKLYPRSKTELAPHAEKSQLENSKGAKLDEPVQSEAKLQTIDMSNNSSIDIYAMEQSPHEDWDVQWPGISEVPYVECLLEKGEALYIPKGWWHYVRGVSASGISVSFWW